MPPCDLPAWWDPVREWLREHPYLGLSAGAVIFFCFATTVWQVFGTGNLESSITVAAAWTTAYFLITIIQIRRRRKTHASLEEHGQFLAYVRYPDTPPGSLSSIWNQGIATPGAGSISFQPAMHDSLEPSGTAATITIENVLPARRKVNREDRKYISAFGLQVMTLMTDGGKLELAAHPGSLDKLSD